MLLGGAEGRRTLFEKAQFSPDVESNKNSTISHISHKTKKLFFRQP